LNQAAAVRLSCKTTELAHICVLQAAEHQEFPVHQMR
jgi:hypothetical protein